MKTAGTIVIIILMAALSLASNEAQARQTLNIGLTRFEAIPLDNAVRLEWDTETELGTAGYRLKRGQNGSFSYLYQSDGSSTLFINSEGGPSLGASYSIVDETAVNGEVYTYQLIEVTVDGSETVQASRAVTTGLVPTNTPIVLSGPGGGGGGNQDTPTPQPTTTTAATLPPSSTPVPSQTAVSTTAPTVTPRVTATQTSTTVADTANDINGGQDGISSTSQEVNTDGPNNPGIAVAQALEDPSAAELLASAETNSEEMGQEPLLSVAESVVTQEENIVPINASNKNERPIVIGNNRPTGSGHRQENVARSQEPSDDVWAGRLYLWVAFIAAIVIFIAAVLGAILLYTRRRNKE